MTNVIGLEKSSMPSLFPSTGDGWSAVPSTGSSSIRGKLLKFTNGEFLIGEEAVNGRELVAVGALTAWVRWAGGRPSEMRETLPGQPHPRREELGELDAAAWEKGLDGNPSDPWRDSRNLFLVDPATGAEFTFATSSWGGRSAIEDLARQIGNVRAAHPKAAPIVKLAVEKMKTRFGLKPKPLFEIVGWKGVDGPAQVAEPAPNLAATLDDDLPW